MCFYIHILYVHKQCILFIYHLYMVICIQIALLSNISVCMNVELATLQTDLFLKYYKFNFQCFSKIIPFGTYSY